MKKYKYLSIILGLILLAGCATEAVVYTPGPPAVIVEPGVIVYPRYYGPYPYYRVHPYYYHSYPPIHRR